VADLANPHPDPLTKHTCRCSHRRDPPKSQGLGFCDEPSRVSRSFISGAIEANFPAIFEVPRAIDEHHARELRYGRFPLGFRAYMDSIVSGRP